MNWKSENSAVAGFAALRKEQAKACVTTAVICLCFSGGVGFAEDLNLLGIAHVGFRTGDLEKARGFYRDVLGYEEAFDLKGHDGQVSIAFFKISDNQFIEIMPGVPPDAKVMMTHIAFYTDDIDKLHKVMEGRGVSPGKISLGKGGERNFAIHAPPGQNLEFLEFTQYMPDGLHRQSKGKSLGERRISTHLEHAGIIATDFETAKHFWVDQMGFTIAWDYKKDGVKTNLLHLRLPGGSGDYVEIGNPPKPPEGRWIGVSAHIALTVPDIQAANQLVKEHGYTGDLKPPLFGADDRWQLNLYDPNGSRVEFMSPKAKGK